MLDCGGVIVGSSPQPSWTARDHADDVRDPPLVAELRRRRDALRVMRVSWSVARVEDHRGGLVAAREALLDDARRPGSTRRRGPGTRRSRRRRATWSLDWNGKRDAAAISQAAMTTHLTCRPSRDAPSLHSSTALEPPGRGGQQRVERAVLRGSRARRRRRRRGRRRACSGCLVRNGDRRVRGVGERASGQQWRRQRVGDDAAGAQRAEGGELGGGLRRHVSRASSAVAGRGDRQRRLRALGARARPRRRSSTARRAAGAPCRGGAWRSARRCGRSRRGGRARRAARCGARGRPGARGLVADVRGAPHELDVLAAARSVSSKRRCLRTTQRRAGHERHAPVRARRARASGPRSSGEWRAS